MKLFPGSLFALFSAAAGICLSTAPSACGAVDTVTSTADSGAGSLRNTIAAAGPGDTIVFSSVLTGRTIYLTSGELFISQNLIIDASALTNGVIINGGGNARVLEIGAGTVAINALTVTNGYVVDDSGAGVFLDDTSSSLTASNCVFCGNSGAEFGGAICVYGTLTLYNCIVSGNSADVYGGGIYNNGGAVTLNNCTLSRNSVPEGGGGGIESEYGTLALNDCIVSSNLAAYFGGGVDDDDDSALAFTNCTFLGNSSGTGGGLSAETLAILSNCIFSNNISTNEAGGGIINYSTLTLNHCILVGNSAADGSGGGLVNGDILTANNCMFSGNTATNGGAIVNTFNMTLNNCQMDGNSVTNGNGGGIYNYEMLVLSNCYLAVNTAVNGNGGAIYNDIDEASILVLTNTQFNGNTAGGVGGGIANGGILTVNNSSFSANTATNGGGIFNGVSMTLNNCTLSGNSAGSGNGGAIYGDSAYTSYGDYATNTLVNCTICDNYALGSGGGIYNDNSSTLALTNTIVASNSAAVDSDVYGVYSGAPNFIGGNPRLAPLGGYGGPTPTMPPEFGSPVIDAGTDWVTNLWATDERGFPRLAGAHVDVGAVEAQNAPANNRPILRNVFYFPGGVLLSGTFRFSFTNAADADFTVLTSTNLVQPPAQWTILGNASQVFFPGEYEFITPVPTATRINGTNETVIFPSHQFYRVVSP